LCATLYAGGAGDAGCDALCALCMLEGCGGWTLFAAGDTLSALCMLEAVEGGLCSLEVINCVLSVRWRVAGGDKRCALRMLEAAESGLGFGASKFPLRQFSRYSPTPLCLLGRSRPRPGLSRLCFGQSLLHEISNFCSPTLQNHEEEKRRKACCQWQGKETCSIRRRRQAKLSHRSLCYQDLGEIQKRICCV